MGNKEIYIHEIKVYEAITPLSTIGPNLPHSKTQLDNIVKTRKHIIHETFIPGFTRTEAILETNNEL